MTGSAVLKQLLLSKHLVYWSTQGHYGWCEHIYGVQALGIALKLTFQGENQFVFIETYFCILVSTIPDIARILGRRRQGAGPASFVLLICT